MSSSITSPGLDGAGEGSVVSGGNGGGSYGFAAGRRAGGHRSTSSMSGGGPPGLAGSHSPSSTGSSGSSSSSLLTIVKAQISFLLSTLSEENFAKNRQDIAGLVEQHSSEAQNYFIRRLLLACAPTLTPSSATSAASSTLSTSGKDSVLSPNGANAPSPTQLPLYLRILQQEAKRLCSDPVNVEKFTNAVLSGLVDPSATTVDVFKTIDLASLIEKLNLTPLERGTLLLELAHLALVEPEQGVKAASGILDQKRKEFAGIAIRLLKDGSTWDEFAADIGSASLQPQQIAKLVGMVSSQIYIDVASGRAQLENGQGADAAGVRCPELYQIKSFNRNLEQVYGSETAERILTEACESNHVKAPSSSDINDAILLIDRLIQSPQVASTALLSAIFRICTASEATSSHALLGTILQDPRVQLVPGQPLVSALEQWERGIQKRSQASIYDAWKQYIKELPIDISQAAFPQENAGTIATFFSAQVASGERLVDILFETFPSRALQVYLLDFLINHHYDFAVHFPTTEKLVSVEKLASGQEALTEGDKLSEATIATIGEQITQVETLGWNHPELVKTLVRLGEDPEQDPMFNIEGAVRNLLDRGNQTAPELVFLAIVKSPKPWGPIASDLLGRLLAYFLGPAQPGSAIAFYGLATEDKPLLLEKLTDFHAESELNASRILDIAYEYKVLGDVLASQTYAFSLDIAALAGRREYLNLEKWLETSTASQGSPFVRGALEFVGHKVRHDLGRQDQDVAQNTEPTTLSLTAPIVATFLRALRSNHEIFGPEEIELFKEVRTQCLQLHPRLMNFAPGAEQEPGISVTTFSPDIEAEVDAFYKRMYDQEISVENVVDLLRRAKESENVHDHDFLACFLHGLFDEYKFFATYPQQELTLTAFLFGSLIQNHLVDYIPLGIAVRYVLDALRNPPDSNWFRFGVQALSRFQPRLHEWPSLAQAILNIPHLAQAHPEIATVARNALAAPENHQPENGLIDGAIGEEDDHVELNRVFLALKPDVTVRQRGQAVQPSEATSDLILFTINNLAPTNLETKIKDIEDVFEEVYYRWFANYLVDQRVSIEPNNHQLYMQFLDALNTKALFKEVQQETLIRAEELLNSEQTIQSSNQRTLLKNLGAWLGALTLAKNQPIKHKNVSFKDLLIEGYDSNRLIVAIPFVCKVLEQCAKSRIFKPPNPWLMAILRLLVELYQFAELKLNLKFEIEVLCKNLNIDLKEIQPTTTLRDRPPKDAVEVDGAAVASTEADKNAVTGFPDVVAAQSQDAPSQGQPGRLPAPASGLSLLGAATSGGAAGYSLALADAITSALATVPQYLSFSPQVSAFSSNATLKRLVQHGIEGAVREIIAPVVERSVTIAGISTRELTIKDFAMEGNEERMRQAAHLMVQNLAGSLALVTCKEPLRTSIVSHIRGLMLQNGFSEQNLPEQAIMVIANDNLELACSVVEKVAMDKAVVEVDDALAPSYMARLKHRERSSQAFWDTAAMAASHYSGMLPDPLRLKLGGLQPNQLRVYEDFGRRAVSSYLQADQPAADDSAGQSGSAAAISYEGQAPGGLLTAQQSSDIFSQLMSELDKAFASADESGITTATAVPQNHEVHMIVRQLPIVASRSFAKDETTLGFSQKVVQLLYRSETALAREVYVVLLQRLCDVSNKVAKEVSAWLIYAPDERKFNVPVTVLLLESGFISVSEYDAQLAKFVMREFRPTVVNFAAQLARECLLTERPIASREHFSHSLRALAQAVQSGKGGDVAATLLDDLRSSASLDAANKSQLDDQAVREQLTMCFVEWVRIYQQSYQIEKAFVEFVVQLQNQGILKGEEISSLFFRVCAEVSVESYIKQKAAGGTIATGLFQPVDAFAKLITFMIKYHADPQNKNNDQAKVHYMTKVLSIVVLVLAQSHEELGPHFQQKPFYRFFSSLLSNLNGIEVHLGSAYYQILTALSHSINTLQPLFFSGFTFSWMGLVAHRLFMPKLLTMKDREGWASFHRLLISLLRFLAPFLRRDKEGETPMPETVRAVYTGTLRIVLVLLHDFPEFLTVYYYSLADAIPASCVQLHNLISSAFPLSTVLPDPLQIKAAEEAGSELSVTPTLLSDFTAALQPADLRSHLERSLQKVTERGSPTGLAERIFLPENRQAAAGTKYNVPLINSIVMFCGSVSLAQSKAQSGTPSFQVSAPAVVLLQNLVDELEPEGSYMVLSAVASHLRYPNSHSTWYSTWLVKTFGDNGIDEYTKEQIVRVLLERLVAHRPHPFGVIATFVQLLRDEAFFQHPFVTKSHEVQLLLNNMRASLTAGNGNMANGIANHIAVAG